MKNKIDIIIDKQQDPNITRAKTNSSKYKANTVNILKRNPNEAKSIVHLKRVILPLKLMNCFFHSGGICFS